MERLTLERAIKYIKEVVQKNRRNEVRNTIFIPNSFISSTDCAEKYEQVEKWLEKLKSYKEAEEQGLLVRLPCKVGDIVYVDSTILPIEDMECYEDIGNKIPSYFQGRVVSFRFAQRNWVKIAVKAKWLYEWIDDETGPESDYIECEKNFSFLLSMIGKTVFLTREEAEKKLEEMKKNG